MTLGAREIPVEPGVVAQRLEVRLDDVRYTLHLRYLETVGWWLLDIHDAEDRPILPGRKVVPVHPLTRLAADPRLPAGHLWVIGPRRRVTLESLGNEHQLLYIPAQEGDS